MGSSKVLLVVCIRTSHLTKHSYKVFEEYTFLTKTTFTKEAIDEKKGFRSEIMVRKEVNDEIQRGISFIKYELQSFIEKYIQRGSKKEKSYWLHADGLKLLITMNPTEKLKNTMNKTSDNKKKLLTTENSYVNITNYTH